DQPSRDCWPDIVPESPSRIRDFGIVSSLVCASYFRDLGSQVEAFDFAGQRYGAIACPPVGTVRLILRPTKSDTLFFSHSSFDQPPTIYSYQPHEGEPKLWARAHVALDPSQIH